MKTVKHNLPSLEKAKELTNFIKNTANGEIILVNVIVPSINAAGISIDKKTQESLQIAHNREHGLLVASLPKDENGNPLKTIVKEGDKVLLTSDAEHAITFSRVIPTEEMYEDVTKEAIEKLSKINDKNAPRGKHLLYKKYLVLAIHPRALSIILND